MLINLLKHSVYKKKSMCTLSSCLFLVHSHKFNILTKQVWEKTEQIISVYTFTAHEHGGNSHNPPNIIQI